MAFVTEYTCQSCGLELVDDGRVFIWDEDSGETRDFLILMNTCHLLHGPKINGSVSETYCPDCGKYVRVYSIQEVLDEVSNPCDVVLDGIAKNIRECGRRLDELKDIRKRSDYLIRKEENHYIVTVPEYEGFYYSSYFFPEMSREEVIEDALNDFHEEIDQHIGEYEKRYLRYRDSICMVLDETGRSGDEFDIHEKVECPGCGRKINKYVSHELGCPVCGGAIYGMGIHYD